MDAFDQRGFSVADVWVAAPMRCMACGHRWVAVCPADTDLSRLECSVCHEQASTIRFVGAS